MEIRRTETRTEEPTKKLIEAMLASGKKIEIAERVKSSGFDSGLEDYPPREDVGKIELDGVEYVLTIHDLVKIINQMIQGE